MQILTAAGDKAVMWTAERVEAFDVDERDGSVPTV